VKTNLFFSYLGLIAIELLESIRLINVCARQKAQLLNMPDALSSVAISFDHLKQMVEPEKNIQPS